MNKNYDEQQFNIIKSTGHFDDNEAFFFAQQVESVKAKVYEKLYPEYTAKKVLPVSTDAGEGAETISYHMYDAVGMAKIVANYATDFPNVALSATKTTIPVVSLGDSFSYSIQDIRSSQMAGRPLEQHLANAARRGIEAKANELAYYGDEKASLFGFLNHPNIPMFTMPNDGKEGLTTFESKSADQCLRDLDSIVGAIVETTKGVESPDTMLVSYKTYRILNGKRIDGTKDTVLKTWLESNPYVKNIEIVAELSGAGTGGSDMLIAYRKDEDKLSLEIPKPFEQFPAQAKGLVFEVPCHERFAGLLVRYPLSIITVEGV